MNTEKQYELRELCADDMFPMFNIINKIGIKEIRKCFESPAVMEAVMKASASGGEVSVDEIGYGIAFDIVGIILGNIQIVKDDVYSLLSNLSGIGKSDIGHLPMTTFTQMIIDVIRKDEFKDFFQAVSKLFK